MYSAMLSLQFGLVTLLLVVDLFGYPWDVGGTSVTILPLMLPQSVLPSFPIDLPLLVWFPLATDIIGLVPACMSCGIPVVNAHTLGPMTLANFIAAQVKFLINRLIATCVAWCRFFLNDEHPGCDFITRGPPG
jgi:hypothetical protein